MSDKDTPQDDSPRVQRAKRGKFYEFTGLKDQKSVTKMVKVAIPQETLIKIADDVTNRAADIERLEKEKSETIPARIKELKAEQHKAVILYREKKAPQDIECTVGFDYEDKAPVKTFDYTKGDPPIETTIEFPLGKKWFVDRRTGNVYGPEPIEPADLQLEIPKPDTTQVGGELVGLEGGAKKDGEEQPPPMETEDAREKGSRVTNLDSRRKKKKGDKEPAPEQPQNTPPEQPQA